jgi:Ca-activated chloride channel family protein
MRVRQLDVNNEISFRYAATPTGPVYFRGAVDHDIPSIPFAFSVVAPIFFLCLALISTPLLATAQQSAVPFGTLAAGQAKPTASDIRRGTPSVPIRSQGVHVNVDLALVNVTVTDSYDRLVAGLHSDNFHVFEDNIEQEVVTFSSEDVPISIGLIFDVSGSMAKKIGKTCQAAIEFFKTANPRDEFFLVTFNDRAELSSAFTDSIEDLQSTLMSMAPEGRTALLDSIYLGLSQMRHARNNSRALLILSDGGDNHSRYRESDIKRLVMEADTQLYAIGVFDGGYGTPEELDGLPLLSEVTQMTGGRVFAVGKLNELSDIASKIGRELRNQYVLGYRPRNKAHDGRWRKIKVKLRTSEGLPRLNVHSKTGYYAPSH